MKRIIVSFITIMLFITFISGQVLAENEIVNTINGEKVTNETENNEIENSQEEQLEQDNIYNNKNTENNLKDSNVVQDDTIEETAMQQQDTIQANVMMSRSTQQIEEGKYEIATALNTQICIDVSGASKSNQANIQLWQYVGEIQQKFEIESDGNGYYIIRNPYTNKVLDVAGGVMASGTNVQQYEYNGTDSQKWIIQEIDDGYYNIISKLSGMYLDVAGGVAKNGTNIQVYTPNGTASQKFKLVKFEELYPKKVLAESTYAITTSINTNYSLDIENDSKNNGANVQLYTYNGEIQQHFKLEYDGNGYYIIRNVYTNKVLDVQGGGINSPTNVQQYEYNGTDSQKWIIQETDDGYYNIISKLNELYLDVSGGKANNGANIQVYIANGTISQKFKIEEIESLKSEKLLENGTYRIATALNNNISIEVSNSSTANGGNVQVWAYVAGNQQKFELEYNENGYYIIRNVNSGKVLDVANGGMASGTNVQQYEYNGTDSQKWIIQETDDGYYNIISKLNELYLDVSGGTAGNGTNIQVYTPNGTDSQKFKFILKDSQTGTRNLDDGTYRIATSLNSNVGLDVSNGSKNNEANVQVWNYDNVEQQQFNIVYDGNGYYSIIPIHSGKAIDIKGGGKAPGTNVQQYEYNGTDSQKWIIKDLGNGQYNIISKLDNLYLDLSQESSANGINVQVSEEDGSKSQKFSFEKLEENKSERAIEEGNYRIAVGTDNSVGLDITGGSTENEANVQLWKYDGSIQQKFIVSYEDDGYYKITSVKSGKVLDAAQGGSTNGTNVQQYEDNGTDSQRWIIRHTSDGHYIVISKLGNVCLDMKYGKTTNGTNIQLYEDNGTISQKFDFISVNIGIDIDDSRYPGIQERINEIVREHPNWNFEILYTGVDFNEAVSGEYSDKTRNLVSSLTYQGAWISPDPYSSEGWYSASKSAIAYFMDPRNFLNDVDVFQFQDVNTYPTNAVTLEGIKNETKGTFLQGFENDINNACISQKVNPYFVLARLFQEQGYSGSEIGTGMKGPDGKTYYNPYNIGAVTGNEHATALSTAMANGWDTMQKALEAGIVILKDNWLENYQNTLYQNKFDIDTRNGSSLYTHQYMQNLSAAYSEGRILRSCYVNTNTLESTFTFIIPVYENMPTEPSERPSNEGGIPGTTSDVGPVNVKVVNVNDVPLKLRSEPNTNGDILAEFPNNGTVLLSVERLSSGWHRIVTTDGKVGYSSGSYLEQIADVTNCNDRVRVTDNDVNLRSGPGTRFSILVAGVNQNLTGTRINKGTYYLDGFSWDEVIFDDGSKGFIATNYLQVVK